MNAKMKEACESVADLFEALPECWTTVVRARNRFNECVEPTAPDACMWCAIGGVSAALNTDDSIDIASALEPFASKVGYRSCPAMANDDGGRGVAIKMLRLAAQS